MRFILLLCGRRSDLQNPARSTFPSSVNPAYPREEAWEMFCDSIVDATKASVDFTKGISFSRYVAVAEALAICLTKSATGPEYQQWFNTRAQSSSAFAELSASRQVVPGNVSCGGDRVKKSTARRDG